MFPLPSHIKSEGMIEQEDNRRTGLSDNSNNSLVSEPFLKAPFDYLKRQLDPEFPDTVHISRHKHSLLRCQMNHYHW